MKIEASGSVQDKRIKVLITVDTETSIGGAFRDRRLKPVGIEKRILGISENGCFGIPYMINLASRWRIPLTFFVETHNSYYFGKEGLRLVCEYIIRKNHDIQLHIHPNYLNFKSSNPTEIKYSDLIHTYSFEQQVSLLEEGKKILTECGANSVSAFRAGCFGADENTLKALMETGIGIDSSYNQSFLNITCEIENRKLNDVADVQGVIEFPITNFIENTGLIRRKYKPLDINGVSFSEMKYVLDQAAECGLEFITIIMHSFSFIKPYDVQYRRTRARHQVVRRFQSLCRYLWKNQSQFEVITFSDINKKILKNSAKTKKNSFPIVPPWLSLLRLFQQLQDLQ